jgi:hypothetical protein
VAPEAGAGLAGPGLQTSVALGMGGAEGAAAAVAAVAPAAAAAVAAGGRAAATRGLVQLP